MTNDDMIDPLNLPAPADLARVLREAMRLLGPASDDAICHVGIVPRSKCCRCSVIDEATALLARVPPGWRK